MARILFINDNFLNESLGIMYLSSYMKANNHEVQLTLLSAHKNIDHLLQFINKREPDLIGFSVMTPQVDTFRPIIKVIKQETHKKIIWGGPHCTFMPDSVAHEKDLDIICIGEGEEALLNLMNRIDSNEDYYDIPNLWIQNGQEWIKNDVAPLESDLDKYPFPDRDLYYSQYPLLRKFGLKRLITQRGCPYNCAYCFEPAFKDLYKGKGKFIRSHSVDYVIEDMKQIVRKYPTRLFHFSNDSFNLNRKWVEEFLQRYQKEIALPFTCNISVPNTTEDFIVQLKDSGCIGVAFGLESGVEHIRMNILNKKISNKEFVEISDLLRKYKLKFLNNILICVPTETLDDAIETIRFNKMLKPFATRVNILKVYKGTGIAASLVDNNLIDAEGEFTYKIKDSENDYNSIKHLIWAGSLFVKIPLLIRFAKHILKSPFTKYLKPLIVLSHLQDVAFYRIPLWQALLYFWHSRNVFMKGLTGEQGDNYKKLELQRSTGKIHEEAQ